MISHVATFAVDRLAASAEASAACVAALESGGLLVFPTDTLYALGGLALRDDVAERIVATKGRDARKGMPVVAADWTQVLVLAPDLPAIARRLARRFWPGPLSLVLPAGPHIPRLVCDERGTIAVRVPALAVTRDLCALAGPLIATSANRSGEPSPTTCQAAMAGLPGAVAVALDGGPARETRPSTIVDLSGSDVHLVREGATPWRDVLRVLGEGT